MYKLQLSTPAVFEIGKLINFQVKNRIFFVLLRLNSRSRDLGSLKLAQMTHLLIPMLSQLSSFDFLPFPSYKQTNPYLSKFTNKNEGSTRSREVPKIVCLQMCLRFLPTCKLVGLSTNALLLFFAAKSLPQIHN